MGTCSGFCQSDGLAPDFAMKVLDSEKHELHPLTLERDSLAQHPLQPLSLTCPYYRAWSCQRCVFSVPFASLEECMTHYRWRSVLRSLGKNSCLPATQVTLSVFSWFLPWPWMSYLGLQQPCGHHEGTALRSCQSSYAEGGRKTRRVRGRFLGQLNSCLAATDF